MKKYLSIVLFSGISFISNAQSSKELYLTKSLAGEAIQTVEASTMGGSISVLGGNGSDARIEVYARDNRGETLTTEEMKSRIDADYDLNITVSNHKLTVVVKQKH